MGVCVWVGRPPTRDNQFDIESRLSLFHARDVSKQVLGRGLGSLMGGNAPTSPANPVVPAATPITSDSPAPSESQQSPSSAKTSRGMETLLQGVKPDPVATSEESGNVDKSQPSVPFWAYFVADIVLVLVAAGVVWSNQGPLSPAKALFCTLAVLLGCFLSVLPFLLKSGVDELPADGPWILCRKVRSSDQSSCHLVIRRDQPGFVGEVEIQTDGILIVKPVAVGRSNSTESNQTEMLAREAAEFCLRTPQYRHLRVADQSGQRKLFGA